MKKYFKLLLVVAAFFALVGIANAGGYTKDNATLYLDGKILIRFDTLHVGWSRDQKTLDRIRYKLTCLKGKAVLNNVEYLDSALEGKESIRWSQSTTGLNKDISAVNYHMDRQHKISHSNTSNDVKIAPYDLKTAKVRFHITASGRNFKVTWCPKTGDISSTW